jgi:hypothetical protein
MYDEIELDEVMWNDTTTIYRQVNWGWV